MSGSGRITDLEVLRALLAGAPVRVAALDRAGRFLLDPDPNPPHPSDAGAPPGASFLELYGDTPGAQEAITAAFSGQVVQLTRELGGSIYLGSFLPRRGTDGSIDSIFAVATVVDSSDVLASALREVQVRERRIFNSNLTGMICWDEHGTLVDANDAFLRITGYTREDFQEGRLTWQAITPPEYQAANRAALEELRARGACTPSEKEYIRKDGTRIPVLLAASSWEAGGTAGIAFVVDISARKRQEREREELQRQLLQAQKLESLGLLAGGIAHDFNNLLSTILGGATVARLSIPADHSAHADIDHVISAAKRAAALTSQMLAYSGKAPVDIRPIDVSAAVAEIVALLKTAISKKIELRLILPANLPAIEADRVQIQQVAMNLMINAADSIQEREGTVSMTTGTETVDAAWTATLAAEGFTPGEHVFLEVRDTGHGMEEATKRQIFEPFFTTKFTGRGLGLAAVLGIVRAHRGAIRVDSTPGRGSTFKVLFPSTRASAVAEAGNPEETFRGEGLVLVIDDERSLRLTTRRMLEIFGFSVIEAEDGRTGLETFTCNASEIVLVLMDMTMPKMSGEETLRAIRALRPEVPVVRMSGYHVGGPTREGGFNASLEKPFDMARLAACLARLLPPLEQPKPDPS